MLFEQNMVGPGEVDDELQDEVKEECAEKYGPVEKCLIHEVQTRVPLEQAIRIFVQFQRPSDAEKGLNARFFGGRKVQATYYDDDRFQRLDLTA
uniref:RNA recognition motif domain-containing protein n=1 Tax=Globisporangium ultimum (strain ATCC 200006 / CBS 805.95 / DAOM BR144) TaxID=431595 RepID=K3WKG0_GLOUD